jgi:hypothetical protein
MKIAAIVLFAFIATVNCQGGEGPTKISGNNVGDIVTVGVNADVDIKNEIDAFLLSLILVAKNQQALVVAPLNEPAADNNANSDIPALPQPLAVDPKMIESFIRKFSEKRAN